MAASTPRSLRNELGQRTSCRSGRTSPRRPPLAGLDCHGAGIEVPDAVYPFHLLKVGCRGTVVGWALQPGWPFGRFLNPRWLRTDIGRVIVMGAVRAVLLSMGVVLATPVVAGAHWISPRELQQQLLEPVTPINRVFREEQMDGPVEPGHIVSVPSLAKFEEVAPTLAPGTWVIYDIERWAYTPPEEQAQPYLSMRRFVTAARGYGFVAVLAPSRAFQLRGARRDADVFLAQVQAIEDPALYRARVCKLKRLFGGPLFAELTANGQPGHTARALYRQWEAGRRCTRHFALWGGHHLTPENVATANRLLAMVP